MSAAAGLAPSSSRPIGRSARAGRRPPPRTRRSPSAAGNTRGSSRRSSCPHAARDGSRLAGRRSSRLRCGRAPEAAGSRHRRSSTIAPSTTVIAAADASMVVVARVVAAAPADHPGVDVLVLVDQPVGARFGVSARRARPRARAPPPAVRRIARALAVPGSCRPAPLAPGGGAQQAAGVLHEPAVLVRRSGIDDRAVGSVDQLVAADPAGHGVDRRRARNSRCRRTVSGS